MFLKILLASILLSSSLQYKIKIVGCQKPIIESYKFTANLVGRKSEFFICPAVKSNCCSIFDQFIMYSTWRDKIKPKLIRYQKGFLKKLFILNKMVQFIDKMQIKKKLMKLRISMRMKQVLIMRYLITKKKRLSRLIVQKIVKQKKVNKYMLKVRSSFYCNICDFQNHPFFDMKKKVISMGLGSCASIVENTIEYSYHSNFVLAKYLMVYSKILNNFSNDEFEQPVILDDYKQIRSNVRMCFQTFKAGLVDLRPCQKYCNYYNFNNHSPFLEGNHNFINDLLNSFARFIKENYDKISHRRLIGKRYDPKIHKDLKLDSIPRFLSEENNPDYKLLYLTKGASPVDKYKEKHQNPETSDYSINTMFNFQEFYEKDLQSNFVKFIKNRLHYFDSAVDFANPGPDEQIFNISSMENANLANYTTLTSISGADLEKNFVNRINEPIRELIFHLKRKSRFRITFEELDDRLLDQVNDITNKNVKDFHQDNFIDFKNFNRELVTNDMMSKFDVLKEDHKRRGWNIK